jgi:hypothetical protein
MKSIFSKFVLAPAVLAAVALAATSAKAEVTIKVPFNFTAGGKICPAGEYTVRHDDNSSFVTLISKSSSQIFTWVVGPGVAAPDNRKIALKFDEMGNGHVLQSVQYGALSTSRLDSKSMRDERESNQLTGGR